MRKTTTLTCILNKIIFTVIILCASIHSYADTDSGAGYKGILLFDSGMSHPILGDIYKQNILNIFGLPVLYSHPGKFHDTNTDGIIITASEMHEDGLKSIKFTLNTALNKNRSLQIEWSLPENAENSELYRIYRLSVQKAVAGALHSKKHDVHSGIMNFYTSSDKIKNFAVDYNDDETTEISGYTLDVSTTPVNGGKFWRTLGEITALNVIGEIDYYMKIDSNTDDWEYQPTLQGFSQKIADGPEFDANNFSTNVAGHIYSGSLYYTSARSNGYSFFESSLFALGGSLMWEYFGEYKERASTNDIIFTTMGGALLGESLTQTSLFVERTFRQSMGRDVLVFLLNPMKVVNQYLDSRSGNSYRVRINILPPAKEDILHMARK
ncbi:MAG: DUF3943 domain-containing protein [Spirochaetota bacterium]